MSAPPKPDHSSSARALNQLTQRPVTWLWPSRLALGKLSLLEGDPQRGKSLLALDLCARLSTGRPWPDGSPSPGPAAALIVNGEDGDEDTTAPRLQALGSTCRAVSFWSAGSWMPDRRCPCRTGRRTWPLHWPRLGLGCS